MAYQKTSCYLLLAAEGLNVTIILGAVSGSCADRTGLHPFDNGLTGRVGGPSTAAIGIPVLLICGERDVGGHALRPTAESPEGAADGIGCTGERPNQQKGENNNEESQNINGIDESLPFFLL